MTKEVSLADLAREIASLRQEIETVNRRLDMVYGAVSRLAEAGPGHSSAGRPDQEQSPNFGPGKGSRPSKNGAGGGAALSARMIMDPGSMLDSLRQYAENAGLAVTPETVERLKSELPTGGES